MLRIFIGGMEVREFRPSVLQIEQGAHWDILQNRKKPSSLTVHIHSHMYLSLTHTHTHTRALSVCLILSLLIFDSL